MVLRKPTDNPADLVPAPLSQAANNPPYPTTPTSANPPALPSVSEQHTDVDSPSLHTSPAFQWKPPHEPQAWKEEGDSDLDDNEDWDKSDDEDHDRHASEELPGALKIGGGQPVKKSAEDQGMPPHSFGAISTSSKDSAPLHSSNPYLRMQSTGQSQNNFGGESSANVWGDAPSASEKWGEPVELPTEKTPVDPFSKMSLSGYPPSPRSNQPPLIPVETGTPSSPGRRHESTASSAYEPGIDISSLEALSRTHGLPADNIHEETPQRTWQEQQDWERSESERKQNELGVAYQGALTAEQGWKAEEDWHRGEEAAKLAATTRQPANLIDLDGRPPDLPPRRSQETENPPPKPPRPGAGIDGASGSTAVETPEAKAKRQRTEHYQIKHIRWFDGSGIRKSPILTQNLNGPCPLLALVNALVLSTPARAETALVETLRTREQVSLGLLLDAVFDELMSGRRGGAAQELPDVTELYSFLVTLHTGMNVNPSFVKAPPSAGVHPALQTQPGGFDDTREMRMYRTFNIPLIHGWLPPSESQAYAAFDRIAKTHDDFQLVQFQEEELDAKLNSVGLNQEEQRLFEDVHAIKDFLSHWPTQLTDYGLQTMTASLKAGEIAILFRNDHFSTLYKEPRSGKLLTLVTDTGYSSHDEIIWESLVDINGQNSELFSGDFRPVGGYDSRPSNSNNNPQNIQSMLDADDTPGAWTTVQPRHPNRRNTGPQTTGITHSTPSSNPPAAPISATEQEDHDLALALQLQEEEEDRHRRDAESRRRREDELSERTIAAHGRGRAGTSEQPPVVPPRRNGVQRPAEERAVGGENLPTYEEAATSRPYHPPANHPASPLAPVGLQGVGQGQLPGSAYQANAAQSGGGGRGGPVMGPGGRRRSNRPLVDQIPGGISMPGGRVGRRTSGIGIAAPAQRGRGQVQQESERCVVM